MRMVSSGVETQSSSPSASTRRRRANRSRSYESSVSSQKSALSPDEESIRLNMVRRRVEALGLELCVSTPEDTILMKLRWSAQAGGSEKQFNDALGVYEFQGDVLDLAYLDRWAETLGLSAALVEIRSRSRAEADESASA